MRTSDAEPPAIASAARRRFFDALQRLVRPHDRPLSGRRRADPRSRPLRFLAVFVVLVGSTVLLFTRLPGSFLPAEDQGYVITVVQAPPGATTERTNEAIEQVKAFYSAQPQVRRRHLRARLQLLRPGPGERDGVRLAAAVGRAARRREQRAGAGRQGDRARFSQIKQAHGLHAQPAVDSIELGVASGFTFKLQDRAGRGDAALLARAQPAARRGEAEPAADRRAARRPGGLRRSCAC